MTRTLTRVSLPLLVLVVVGLLSSWIAAALSASTPATLETAKQALAADHASVVADESALASARSGEAAAQRVVTALEGEAPKEEQPGAVLWYGDGIHGSLSSQWAAVSDQANCAVTSTEANTNTAELKLVSDPRFAKGTAVGFHENGGSPCYSGRDELTQGNPYSSSKVDRRFYSGHTYDLAWQALLPTSYPFALNGSGGMVQIHRTYNGKSPFGLGVGKGTEAGTGYLILFLEESPSGPFTETKIATIHAERVYNFEVEYVARNTATGSFKVYESEAPDPPVLIAERTGFRTILPDQNGTPTEPDFMTIGLYPGNVNNQELRIAGFTVASTLEAAAANALH